MVLRPDLLPWWRPVLASLLATGAVASILAGFARVFFVEVPGPWIAAQGGALVGAGIVGVAWSLYLIREWLEAPDAVNRNVRGGGR